MLAMMGSMDERDERDDVLVLVLWMGYSIYISIMYNITMNDRPAKA